MSEATVDDIFNQMVDEFKANKNKPKIIEMMTAYCSKETTTPQQIYDLKKMLEVDFSKKVDCKYCYKSTSTPTDYGCDLREIFYDRKNTLIEGGQALLDIFNEKKLPDMWHIMTDIDDTLYPNLEHGSYIAGSDLSWTEKKPYPGIVLFYNLFYQHLPVNSRYTTILSATPGCFKYGKLVDEKGLLHSIIQNYGFIHGPDGKGQFLNPGAILDVALNCIGHYCGYNNNTYNNVNDISNLHKLLGNTKFERFKQYISIFPEYKILFIGDNGQGDVLAGKQMLEFTDRCRVFIHKVSEDGVNFKTVLEESSNIPRLNFFKNYYDVAFEFEKLGIFNTGEATEVKNEIVQQLKLEDNSKFATLYNISGGKSSRKTIKKIRKYKTRKIRKYKYKSTKKYRK
jgi:hypothetical protein